MLWNLDSIYNSLEEWKSDFFGLKTMIDFNTEDTKEILCDKNIKELLTIREKEIRTAEKLYVYSKLKFDLDLCDDTNQRNYQQALELLVKVINRKEKMSREIEKIKNTLNDQAKHNEIIEKKLKVKTYNDKGKLDHFMQQLEFNKLSYRKILNNTKNMLVNEDEFYTSLYSNDAFVRKSNFKNYHRYFFGVIDEVSELLISQIKIYKELASIQGFDSALTGVLNNDMLNKEFFIRFLKNINQNISYFHKYIDNRKKCLEIEELHSYDLYYSPERMLNDNIETIDQALSLVKEALAPLGTEYQNIIEEITDRGLIHSEMSPNRRRGSYSIGSYDTKQFILLEWQNDIDGIHTLAHEIGHSVHSTLSNEYQGYSDAGYSNFIGEVFALLNEVLVVNYLINNTENPRKKREYISYYIRKCIDKVFNPALFSEFEYWLHEQIDNSKELSSKDLSDKYYKVYQLFYGPHFTYDDENAIEWVRIPHLFDAFYLYKYAAGYTIAISLYSKILQSDSDFVKKLINILKAGKTISVADFFEITGIEINEMNFMDDFFQEFDKQLYCMENTILPKIL
ncbi:M3 family metallopeptidase [Bacillus sp. 2205SS5-2]|uniref:M3 family metallopeptidase n=1 Tax=Bacillus sp. 2205SS5-2 TaxID=3109031 RepID=UPI003007ADC7